MEIGIAVLSAVSGIILGWAAREREVKKEARSEGELKKDVEYIKEGVDDIKEQIKEQGAKVDNACERIAKLEAKDQEQDRRIAALEARR